MNDREIIERLAKWVFPWLKEDTDVVEKFGWNPLESLDDCRIVENEIAKRGLEYTYLENLVANGFPTRIEILYLTARQRCEAILRTIGEE